MGMVKFLVGLVMALLLAACGGGGGDSGDSMYGGGTDTTDESSTSGSSTAVAADLLLSLSSTTVSNSGAAAVTVTVTAVDSSRVVVGEVPVSLSVDNNAVVAASGSKTGSTGTVTGTVQLGNDRSNRIITVTATSGSVQRSASFSVTGTKLEATVLQTVLSPGDSGQIDYQLLDVNRTPMVGVDVSISAPGLATVTGKTDTNGAYRYSLVAPATVGNLDVVATAAGVTQTSTVIVQSGTGTIPAVTTAITSASVTANPSVVAVNSASSSNRSEVRALFLGANNLPIPNVRVRFDLAGDANSIGGTLTTSSNVVLSDSNGIATSAYVPGTRSSPTDGVTVRACYYLTDMDASAGGCANSVVTTLTVISEPLAVSIGTNNEIKSGADELTYIKKFVVLVVDSSGQAKANVQVTPSVDLISYRKGFYKKESAEWVFGYVSGWCLNEDENRNGVLEDGEDINTSGQLDPRKSDVAISMIGSGLTDSYGVAILQIQYPKNVATWVNYRILVSASGVSGTEGRAQWNSVLSAAVGEYSGAASPSFMISPYGVGSSARTASEECRAAD